MRREIGGVERWARELSNRLPALRPGRYSVMRPPATLAHGAGQAWEQVALPLAARRSELLLSPANMAPLAGRGNVVVIHDVAPFREPDWFGRAYGAWHRALMPRIARGARLVIAPSEFVRGELVELLGLDPGRVRAIAPGVDAALRRPRSPEPLLRRLGLEQPYVLALGTDSPRKNLGLLDRIAPALAAPGFGVAIAGSGRSYLPVSPRAARDGSATCPKPTCRRSTPAPRRSPCPRSTRASGCRAWRRWPPARRWWPQTAPRYRRRAAARPCWWTRRPRRLRRRADRRGGPSASGSREVGARARRGLSWARSAESVDAAIGAAADWQTPVAVFWQPW